MNLLIVDDEKIIVEGIRLLVLDSGYSFENIFLAYSGEEALKILCNKDIDIVFSDIKMPLMDGFGLIDRLNQMANRPEIIMITGYAEFNYVQRAINSGIVGYILKPIDEDLFGELLKKAVDRVYKKKSMAKTEANVKDLNRKLINLRLEQFINVVFNGGILGKEDRQWLKDTICAQEDTQYLLVSVHVLCDGKFSDELDTVSDEIRQQLEKVLNNETDVRLMCFIRGKSLKEFHYLCVSEYDFQKILPALRRFYSEYSSGIPARIYISVSDARRKISRELFVHSQEAYYEHYLKPEQYILQYTQNVNIQKISLIEDELKAVEIHIGSGDMVKLKNVLKYIFSVSYISNSKLTVRAVYLLVANTVIMALRRINVDIPSETVDELLSESPLPMIQKVDDLSEYIYNVIFELLLDQQENSPNTDMLIKRIVHHVNVNYSQELSVKDIGNKFGLTPNYLSRIFKTETGMSFVKYLNNLRIEKACSLLKNSDIKIVDIAKRVGYNDNQYFYRVFKKYVGKTPIEYRIGADQS